MKFVSFSEVLRVIFGSNSNLLQGSSNVKEDGCQPGIYLFIKLLEHLIKIGMSDSATKGMFGRVDRQRLDEVSLDQCSAICMTRDEVVELMENSDDLDSFIKTCCNTLPAYQYNEDHGDQAYAEIANQVMESTLASCFVGSESRKIELGLGLERLLSIGSQFINVNCCFPNLNKGDNKWIVNFTSRSVSCSANTSWITVPSQLFDMADACTDDLTVRGVRDILSERPRGDFVTNVMMRRITGILRCTSNQPRRRIRNDSD